MVSLQLSSLNLLKLMLCSLIHTEINCYFYRKNLLTSIKHMIAQVLNGRYPCFHECCALKLRSNNPKTHLDHFISKCFFLFQKRGS